MLIKNSQISSPFVPIFAAVIQSQEFRCQNLLVLNMVYRNFTNNNNDLQIQQYVLLYHDTTTYMSHRPSSAPYVTILQN